MRTSWSTRFPCAGRCISTAGTRTGDDYLPVWGAREFLVDGHDEFARWDDLAIFIDKASGAVREEQFLPNRLKIRAMSPVERADRPID